MAFDYLRTFVKLWRLRNSIASADNFGGPLSADAEANDVAVMGFSLVHLEPGQVYWIRLYQKAPLNPNGAERRE